MSATSNAFIRAPGQLGSSRRTRHNTRIWLDFINTDTALPVQRGDLLRDFGTLVQWMVEHNAIDKERAFGLDRRALLQPAAATAALVDARRVRASLRQLVEKGTKSESARDNSVVEINRVLGRSTGTRKLELQEDNSFMRVFVPTGDAFAGLMIPVVESAADSLIANELIRIKKCAEPVCSRVFLDESRNGSRKWCDMGSCGNRSKAARHRARKISLRKGGI